MSSRAQARAGVQLLRRVRRAVSRRLPRTKAIARPPAPRRLPTPPGATVTATRPAGEYAGQLLRPGWLPKSVGALARTDRRLLLIHVPKTGGSSLRTMFESHVPPEEVFLSTGAHEWVERSVADLRPKRLFVGHQFLEPLYLFPQDEWVSALVVRDPLGWWRSWYKYGRRRGDRDPAWPQLPRTFGAFVDASSDLELSNPQTSWLLARTRVMFDSPHARKDRLADTATRRHDDVGPTMELLDSLLSRVTALGTTEQLTSVYRTTCRAMGWEPAFDEALRENRSKLAQDALDLTPAQEDRLLGLTRIDTWMVERAERAGSVDAGRP